MNAHYDLAVIRQRELIAEAETERKVRAARVSRDRVSPARVRRRQRASLRTAMRAVRARGEAA